MSAALEAFLARIYVDDAARARFLADPRREASQAGLGPTEIAALDGIDRLGLELASASFAKKRARRTRRPGSAWARRLLRAATALRGR